MRLRSALLVVVVLFGGCSDGDGSAATTTTAAPRASEADGRWAGVMGAPCELLAPREVADLADDEQVASVDDAPFGTCRYDLGGDRTVEVVVFRPMTDRARAVRLRGTSPGTAEGVHELRLDVPGAARYVGDGPSLVLIAYRTTTDGEPADSARLTEIASLVGDRLPGGSTPAEDDPDPCDAVPVGAFGAELQGGDPRDADTCALRGLDGTSVVVRIDRRGTMPEAGGLTEPWDEVGGGATWQGTPDPDAETGSGVGFVPLDPGVASITVSSPARPLAELRRQAEAVAISLVTGS